MPGVVAPDEVLPGEPMLFDEPPSLLLPAGAGMPDAPDVPDVPDPPELLGAGVLAAPGAGAAGAAAGGAVLGGVVVVVVVDSVVGGLVTGGGAADGVVVVVVVLLPVPLAAGSLLALRLQPLSRMPATAVAKTIFVRLMDAFIVIPFTEIG